jgi:hypothetical protein
MGFLGETILLPKLTEVPDFVIFYKRVIHDITGKKIKVYSKELSPVKTKIIDCRIYDDDLTFLTYPHVTADSHNNLLTEIDIIDEPLHINLKNIMEYITDDIVNRLIQEMIHDPSLAARIRIPKALWEYPTFKRKIGVERTKGRLKSTNSSGLFVHDKLPDGPLSIINDMVGLNSARRNTMRLPPPPPHPHPPPRHSTCTGSSCAISGGRRKRTRRFKK